MSGFLGLTGGAGALTGLSTFYSVGAIFGLGKLTLQLGDVIFNESTLEVPEEIGDLGGTQVIAQHDFPGGARTQQVYGAFPKEISWKGRLTGSNALSRALTIDQIRVAGQLTTLSYGPKSFSGRVVEFSIVPHTQWHIHYTLRFLPLQDTAQQLAGLPSPEIQIATQTGVLTQLLNNVPFPLPLTMVTAVVGLQATVQSSLQAANGVLQNIGLPALQAISTAATLVNVLAPGIIAGSNHNDAYMAGLASNSATVINQLAISPTTPTQTIVVINPNLPRIAAQYLNDATQWPAIAALNNIVPPTPFPLGTFQLAIP